ncbi:hypothetical protein GCM10009749_08350 [Agromyces neolithicus]|uniref:YlxR domain-containing protein n=1 Tax=Agromyces neolithicus TaxID=269420 RepID=A0ABP4Y5U6_9MICO
MLPGRGAWLHPTLECYRLAVQRRAFTRALRIRGEVDTSNVENRLKANGQLMSGSK